MRRILLERNDLNTGGFILEAVHIFGLDHFLQPTQQQCWTAEGRESEAQQKAALGQTLAEIITNNHVGLVAEEAHPDLEYIGAVLANHYGHLDYVDITMPSAERERRGIRPNYNGSTETRERVHREFEQYMFEQTATRNARVVLVICGRQHSRGLAQLFAGTGAKPSVYDVLDYQWYRGIPKEEMGGGIVGYDRGDAP